MKNFFLGLACLSLLFTGCGDSTDLLAPMPDTTNSSSAPVAVADTFSALGNTTLTFGPNAVLANDTRQGANILAYDRSTTNGGSVLLNLDGSFTYTAAIGFRGVDQFSYTLQNSFGTSQATVSLQINQVAHYVDNTVTNGNGTQAAPFASLNQALQAADPNDIIFVFRGDGTSVGGGVNLQNGQQLLGQGTGLQFNGFQIAPAGEPPVLSGNITVADDNTIAGFDLRNPTGDSITAMGVSGLSVRNNNFSNVGQDGIDLSNVVGTSNIEDNTFSGISNDVIRGSWSVDGAVNIINNTFNDDANSDPNDIINLRSTAGTITVQATGNLSEPTSNSNAYNSAVDLQTSGTGNINYRGSNNTFRNTADVAIMNISNGTGLLSTSHTSLVTSGGAATSVSSIGNGNKRHLITNSNLADASVNQIIIASSGAGDATVAVRSTTFSQGFFTSDSTGTFCLDAEQNTVAAIVAILANPTGVYQVEDLATLSQRNNNAQAVTAGVTNADNGACGI